MPTTDLTPYSFTVDTGHGVGTVKFRGQKFAWPSGTEDGFERVEILPNAIGGPRCRVSLSLYGDGIVRTYRLLTAIWIGHGYTATAELTEEGWCCTAQHSDGNHYGGGTFSTFSEVLSFARLWTVGAPA